MNYFKNFMTIFLCLIICFGLSITAFAQAEDTVSVSANATILNNSVIVNVNGKNIPENCFFIAALFNDEGSIVSVTLKKAKETTEMSFKEGLVGNKVKVFLWESLVSIKPLCDITIADIEENIFYDKTLYVDGDSICNGNGYIGGYGKIIADKYGMRLINNGVGGATIAKSSVRTVEYKDMNWDKDDYYVILTNFDAENRKNLETFGVTISKEQYFNGFGVYPTVYLYINGEFVEQEYSELIPNETFYVKFNVETYEGNSVPKYYRMWTDKGYGGNDWFWEAYHSGFDNVHKEGYARFGTANHWLCDSVDKIDTATDYIVFEGGINDYNSNRQIGVLTEGRTEVVDTTTLIGGMEYICRKFVELGIEDKVIYLITHKAKNMPEKLNSFGTLTDYHNAMVSVLKKYDIQYVDLFETEFDTSKEEYLQYTRNRDGVHPTKEGYEKFYVPYIVKAMKK